VNSPERRWRSHVSLNWNIIIFVLSTFYTITAINSCINFKCEIFELHSISVEEKHIHVIASILADCPVAVEKREQVYGALGLSLAGLVDMRRKLDREYSGGGSYAFFADTLSQYHSRFGRNGTLKSLLLCLTNLSLHSAARKWIHSL
jgi:hypothetical protein